MKGYIRLDDLKQYDLRNIYIYSLWEVYKKDSSLEVKKRYEEYLKIFGYNLFVTNYTHHLTISI